MSVLAAFARQCAVNPGQIALSQDDRCLSYSQTQELAEKISGFLLTQETACFRVAIALDRGIDAAIAILGVLSAGACYIPLDVNNPIQRLKFIVTDADVQFVIGKGKCPSWLQQPEQWLDIEQLIAPGKACTTLISPTIEPEQLAAILYTSGSTGTPKGVALSHKAMLNFSNWAGNTFAINSQDQIASLAPFYFDLSVFDLFTSLNFGASIFFMPSQLTLMPSRLSLWLSDNNISRWYTVPSLLSFLTYKGALDTVSLPNLKTILFAGEIFPTKQLISLTKQLPQVEFFNLYGPTETNVCCYWKVDRKRLQADQAIPIGHSAGNAQLKITDSTGELLVQSDNNMSGYWQRGQCQPFNANNTWFATGDKVTTNSNGEYCYHGRLDRMLKCSGYRVEPAEIEAVIQAQPGIKYCAVIGVSDDIMSSQRPAAIVVLEIDAKLVKIRKTVNQALPSYMQPAKFLSVDSLPYLANGKTDYQALEKMIIKKHSYG